MSPRDPIFDALMRQARDKRLAGEPDAALPLVDALLRRHPERVDVRDEALLALIATGRAQRAFEVLGQAGAAGVTAPPAPEVAARLAVDLGLDIPLAGLAQTGAPRWVLLLARDGNEPIEAMVAKSMRVASEMGRLVYVFHGDCAYCGHQQGLTLVSTLLTRRTWFCPGCLGRLTFDHAAARAFVARRYGGMLARSYAELEAQTAERVKERLLGERPSPPVVAALGQGYQFLLNELALRLVLDAGEDGPGPGAAAP